MQKPFHFWLPDWIHKDLNKRSCTKCKTKYTQEDIVGIGIRQIENSTDCAMYVEHICSLCAFRALTLFGKEKETTLSGMCCGILEDIKRKRIAEKSRRLVQNHKTDKMTEGETKKFLKFLKNADHAEFLKEIGVKQNPNAPN